MLQLCDACQRHIRTSEASCPFCGEPARVQPARPAPKGRSRAAQLAIAATLMGCKEEPHPQTPPAPAPSVVETTQPAPPTLTAAPGPTPTPTPTPSPSPVPKQPPPNVKKPYGAPPADGLLV